MIIVEFTLEQGNKYFGKIDGNRFFIGKRVSFDGGKGLMNIIGTPAQRYKREEFREAHGFWADFIHPTAMAEGALYHTLNTYDRARFTFTFLQYAAHVPNGDFVVFFRELLKLPLATEYFPDLTLVNNRISRVTDHGTVPLESDSSTSGLMDFLNPSRSQVEDNEVIQAAKFVHWSQNDPLHRQTQIDTGIKHFKQKMVNYANTFDLDGALDTVCLVIADIRHQGRAKNVVIANALNSSKPLDSLLSIGAQSFSERIATLKREIKKLTDEGTLGTHKYSLAEKDFIAG
jgi:hypothetical protein